MMGDALPGHVAIGRQHGGGAAGGRVDQGLAQWLIAQQPRMYRLLMQRQDDDVAVIRQANLSRLPDHAKGLRGGLGWQWRLALPAPWRVGQRLLQRPPPCGQQRCDQRRVMLRLAG
ncbi:hypothetical protein D3C72_2062580 [compost metagenome]